MSDTSKTTTSGEVPGVVPSTPDPSIQALIFALLRAALYVLGTLGISVTALGDQTVLWALAGGLSTLVALVWSLVDKVASARKAHLSAVVSATAAQPLEVTK